MSLILQCDECKGDLEEHEAYYCDICEKMLCSDDIKKSNSKKYDYLCIDCYNEVHEYE